MRYSKVLRAILIILVGVLALLYVFPTINFYSWWQDEYEEDHFVLNWPGGYETPFPSWLAPVGRVLPKRPVKLGLDLKGGIYLVYEVDATDLSEKELRDAVNMTVEIIRKRVDELGVAEPEIQSEGSNRIVVKLPGIKDPARAKDLIGTTALLEFKLVNATDSLYKIIQEYDQKKGAGAAEGKYAALGDRIQTIRGETVFYEDDYERVREAFDDAAEMGLVPSGWMIAFSNAVRSEDDGTYLELGGPYRSVYLVSEETPITGKYLRNAQMDYDQYGKPNVAFTWDNDGARIFGDLTGAHIEERLAILLDGYVQSAPVIQSRITTQGEITGNFTSEEASDLALVLRSGALPAKLWLIQEQVVGPSLGRDAIRNGVIASVIAFAIIIALTVFYYHFAGLVADLALIFNLVIVVAVMVLIHATLTLPGIAGLILSVAMAIDANVLIYERIREELRSGKTVKAAVDTGYRRAFLTIFDSNITTVIAAIFLYLFGTGPIRGFAVTLTIGIAASMFTAIVVTKGIFDYFTGKGIKKLYIG
ncbi:MAG: protein translocase subunit SecD [Candidatus Zixiibacteriota bacterium]